MSGDGQISAQLGAFQAAGPNARAGVMIRETLAPGSRYAFLGLEPDGQFCSQYRTKTSHRTSLTKSGPGSPPNTWVRLVRVGNTLYGYRSTEGINWSLVDSVAIPMATSTYLGFAVASGGTNTPSAGTFTNATIIP